MNRPRTGSLLGVLACAALVLGGCGDGENPADPTPPLEDDPDPTVHRDDSGAVDEPDDEPGPDGDAGRADGDGGPVSDAALVVGPFGDRDLELVLTEVSQCAIREASGVVDDPEADVEGATDDGNRFSLEWSVSDVSSTLQLDGTTWTAETAGDEVDEETIRITRNGGVFFDATYESDGGELRDAQLYVNCRPAT